MDNKNKSRQTNSNEKKEESFIEELKDVEYPVQQVGNESPNSEDVKDAVKELNPDLNSMGFRG